MDRGWSPAPAGCPRNCSCHYCSAGRLGGGGRGLGPARRPSPYTQGKRPGLLPVRRNGGHGPGRRALSTEPGWAQRQAGRIRAWRQAEKIRAWRQALNKEQPGRSEAQPGEQESGLAASADQPNTDQPNTGQTNTDLALNGAHGGYTALSPPEGQEPGSAEDAGGDIDLSSGSEAGGSESGQLPELSTATEQGEIELVKPVERKAGKPKRLVSKPIDKAWALEQAARIKAWREAKSQKQPTIEPSTLTLEIPGEKQPTLLGSTEQQI